MDDCVTRLQRLEAKGRVWGQEVILEVQGGYLQLNDIETKVANLSPVSRQRTTYLLLFVYGDQGTVSVIDALSVKQTCQSIVRLCLYCSCLCRMLVTNNTHPVEVKVQFPLFMCTIEGDGFGTP